MNTTLINQYLLQLRARASFSGIQRDDRALSQHANRNRNAQLQLKIRVTSGRKEGYWHVEKCKGLS